MKKLFTLLLAETFFCVFFTAISQIKITQDDLAPAGTYLISALDTGNLDSIVIGEAGENAIWDFSMLQNTAVDTVKILHPDDTPFGASFPQSNKVVQEYGSLYYYLKESSSSIDAIGLGGTFSYGYPIVASAPLSPAQTYLQFPSTYQTSYKDVSAVQFKVYLGTTVPYNGQDIKVDSVKFIRKISKEVIFDGYGTTITPLGSFPCIREKSIETNHDSIVAQVVIPPYINYWFPFLDTQTITVNYRYWAKEIGYSLVNLTTDTSGRIQTAGYLFTKPAPIAGPVANFTVNTNTPVVGDTVFFKDLSLGVPETWYWEFGDGTNANDQNPFHIYNDTGIFAVTLIISNQNGGDTLRKQDYITVSMPPVKAAFDFVATGLKVKFYDKSQNIIPQQTLWRWDFGDSSGNINTSANPPYSYSEPGTYLVCVTVDNSLTKDSTCRSVKVSVNSSVDEMCHPKKTYWSVVPNPSYGDLNLIQKENTNAEIKSFSLFDCHGRKIYGKTFSGSDISIPADSFQKGIFFYRFTEENGKLLQSGRWMKL